MSTGLTPPQLGGPKFNRSRQIFYELLQSAVAECEAESTVARGDSTLSLQLHALPEHQPLDAISTWIDEQHPTPRDDEYTVYSSSDSGYSDEREAYESPVRFRYPSEGADLAATPSLTDHLIRSDYHDASSVHEVTTPMRHGGLEYATPQDEIAALHAYIDELHIFVQKSGIVLDTPVSIRRHLNAHNDSAESLAHNLTTAINDAVESMPNSSSCSHVVLPFLPDVRALSQLPQPGSTGLAMDTLLMLGRASHADLGTPGKYYDGEYGPRPFDLHADDLMCYLLDRRRRVEPAWEAGSMLEELAASSDHLAGYGYTEHFVQAVALLREWAEAGDIDMS